MIEDAKSILQKWNGEVLEANTELDHIHLLISMDPKYTLSYCIGSLKNSLARKARNRHREYLDQFLWEESFWSDSYYIASTGGANLDTVKSYIENQGKPKRKYIKKNTVSDLK